MKNPLLIMGMIILPFILFFSSFFFTFNEREFYLKEFHKYDVYDKVENPELNLYRLLDFLNDPKATETGIDDFNEKEESHMRDVKDVFKKAKNIYIFLLVLEGIIIFTFLLKKNEKIRLKSISKLFFYGGCVSLVILVLIFVMSILSFDFLFIRLLYNLANCLVKRV